MRKVRCVVGVTWEVRRRNCMSKVSVFLLRISWLIREVWPEYVQFQKQRSMPISVARQHKRTSSTRLMVKTASRLRMILRLSGMRARLMRRNYNVSSHRNGLRTSRCLARLGRNFVVQVIRNYSRTA